MGPSYPCPTSLTSSRVAPTFPAVLQLPGDLSIPGAPKAWTSQTICFCLGGSLSLAGFLVIRSLPNSTCFPFLLHLWPLYPITLFYFLCGTYYYLKSPYLGTCLLISCLSHPESISSVRAGISLVLTSTVAPGPRVQPNT